MDAGCRRPWPAPPEDPTAGHCAGKAYRAGVSPLKRPRVVHHTLHTERQERQRRQGALDWADWWHTAADDPLLAEATAQRFALLGDPREPSPHGGARRDRPTATRWHLETLLDRGFSEARQVWCSASDALVAALR
ncbi:hypothetical protein [Streptomyces sp. HNM1019]|uniref:hypothetical protein n=1 Tax=Streptomyces sp. HNM1019 TaxID=3424717 RepID=UPI003D780AFE